MAVPPTSAFSQPNLDKVLNAIQQAVITTDLTGRVTYWNRAAETLYGWSASETLGRHIVDITPPEMSREQAEAILQRLMNGESWSGEFLVRRKDGSLFTATVTNAPLLDDDGQLCGIVGISVLFDARRQIEETVAKLAAVSRSTRDAIVGYGLDGTILGLNAGAEQLFGVKAQDIIGQPARTLVLAEQSDDLERLLAVMYSGQPIENYEAQYHSLGGETFDIRLSLSPIEDQAGRLIGAVSIARDITEQKQAERQLRASEALHQLILGNISDAVFITDEAGRFTYICPNVDVIWGYSQADVARFGNISRLLGSTLCDSAALDAAGELRNIDCEIATANGQARTLLVNIKRVDIAAGTRLYTCRDTSERKEIFATLAEQTRRLESELSERGQIEAALRHSEQLLRNVLETLPVGVWVTDKDGAVMLSNPAAEAIWGQSDTSGNLIPDQYDTYQAWWSDTGERITRSRWGLMRALQNGEQVLNEVIDIQAADGERRAIINSAVPIRDAGGAIIGAIAVNQDVTEQRRAQQAEREERLFATAISNIITKLSNSLDLQSVLETILENIGQVVPHDASNLTLIEGDLARPICWRGYTEEANIYFANLRYPLTTSWIQRMLETGEPELTNDVTGKKNWPMTPALAWIGSVLSVPIRAHSVIIGFLNLDSATPGFFTPTHRKRLGVFADQSAIVIENAQLYTQTRNHAAELEQRVRARTLELEQALAKEKELGELKSRFVSMVSHEFRTPLASIQTSSDLLQHYYDRMTPERRREALQKIELEIKRLTTILENVLAFGRAEAVGIAIRPARVDIVKLCNDIASEVRQSTRDGHTLVVRSNRPDGVVELDTKVMRHALINLLENAIKYSPADSTVTLQIAVLDKTVVIDIADQGIGIPPADLPQLFEAFHRGRNVGNAYGTGLGLVIVKQAVDAHHGSITVDSQVECGTTFTLTLPRTQG